MATRWARVVRGIVASLLATFVAGLAHIVGGGSMPSLAGAALVLALCVPASILLAGRTISTARLAIAVVLSQAGFHLLFWLTGDSSAALLPRALAGVHAMEGMAGMATAGGVPAAAGMAGAGGMAGLHGASDAGSMATSGWMWAAHALAAALTVVALRYGEGAFWALISAARLNVIRFVKSVTLTLEFPQPTAVGFVVRVDGRDAPFLWSGLRHRGPPARTLASA